MPRRAGGRRGIFPDAPRGSTARRRTGHGAGVPGEDIGYAWAAGIHDVESNRYTATSFKDLVEVANRYRKKAPGGSWKAVQEMLEQVYGAKRRMFIYRTR